MSADGALYLGRVTHRRLRPVSHRFAYRVFSLLVDVDRLDALARRLRWFSRGRFNLFSFHDRDYGDGAGDVAEWVRAALREAGLPAGGRVLLLCYPRMLGYAFNPLAVYYCHDEGGRLGAIIYEVRNTFGGKHCYLIPVRGRGDIIRQDADKVFHVSPFMAMETRYRFRLSPPGDDIAVVIRQTDGEGPIFNAAFAGRRATLDDAALLRAFCAYPLMTLKVIAGIHFEALRLLLKGMRLRKGAPEPGRLVTAVDENAPDRKAA